MAKAKPQSPLAAFITLQWLPRKVRWVLGWIVIVALFALMLWVFWNQNEVMQGTEGIQAPP